MNTKTVAKSRAKRLREGRGERIDLIISPEAAKVLDAMVTQGWAKTRTEAINKSILAQVESDAERIE